MSFMPTDHYKAGDVIFEEGYAADGVYLICSGQVKVIKKRAGQEIILANLGEEKIFGEMAFIDERPRSATVIATEDTWCYKHNKDVFFAKIKALDPSVSAIFHELVDVIKEKSNAQVLIDHGNIRPITDFGLGSNINLGHSSVLPSRSKIDLLADKKLHKKVDDMDLFMRTLFASLVEIAYK
jgi:CRP-like cAMP-binding protein